MMRDRLEVVKFFEIVSESLHRTPKGTLLMVYAIIASVTRLSTNRKLN